jgi:PAS domain S-box-containing protein
MNFSKAKIFSISFIILFFITSGVFLSISILKDEAVKTHLKLVELYSTIFADNMTKTVDGITFLVNNLVVFLENEHEPEKIHAKLNDLLRNNFEIRSINILDEENRVINSSNELNKGIVVKTNEFFPQSNFDKNIFRIGKTKEGRDLYEAKDIEYINNDLDINFFSFIKEINIENKKFNVLININGDFILNSYNNLMNINNAYIDILRLDGNLLITNDFRNKDSLLNKELLENIKNRNIFSGVMDYNLEKTILSYKISDYYPLIIAVRVNFDKTLKDWEQKSYVFLLTIFMLLLITFSLIVSLFYVYNRRKEKELFLHKKFKILFEQSNFFATVINCEGKILEINHTFANFFKEIDSNKNIWEYYCWPKEEKKWLENLIKRYDKNEQVQKELNIFDKKGKQRVLELVISSFENDGKKELVLIALDITSKKEKEQELKNAYIVFQNAHDGIVVTDEKVNIINVNRAFENDTGYKLDEIFGKNPRILKSGIQDVDFYKKMWEKLNKEGYWEGELVNKNKQGNRYIERIKINAVYDENKKLTNYIALFSDITLQKEQEKLLKEKEELLFQQSKLSAMGEMIGNIAHQWRQPLSVISSSISAIKLSVGTNIYTNEELINFMDTVLNSTKYLSETIDDFRNFYKKDLEKEEFAIKNAIDMSFNLVKTELVKHGIKTIFINDTDFNIMGVKNQFLQVLMNILSNSKDAFIDKNIDDKTIFINLYEENDKKCIEIYDNAGGIKDDVIEHVFEPYFTTKHKSIGTGIGLYMSQEIIAKHLEGQITVTNKEFIYQDNEYKGACFKITI